MKTFLMLFLVSILSAAPAEFLNELKTVDKSYICYSENDNLIILKVLTEGTILREAGSYNTGISTKSVEKITMTLQNGLLCVEINYSDSEALAVYVDSESLEIEQIGLMEESVLATRELVH